MIPTANYISLYFQGKEIRQRTDGYLNASDMCSAYNKQFSDYTRLQQTKDYLEALIADRGCTRTELIVTKKGGVPNDQGSYIHPLIGVNLAQWLSPVLAVQASKWIARFVSGDLSLVPQIIRNNEITTGSKIVGFEYVDLQKEIISLEERRTALDVKKSELIDKRATALESLERIKNIDCHLYTAMKADFINSIMPANYNNHLAIQDNPDRDIMNNKDLSTLAKEELGYLLPNNKLCALGKLVKKGYLERHHTDPVKCMKHVAGSIRSICVYAPVDYDWIRQIIREYIAN